MRGVCRLRRFAWGRPGAKGRVSEQVRHTTFVTVPPRYGFAVVKPGRYSSRPFRPSAVATATRVLRIPCHLRFAPARKSLPGSQDAAVPAAGADSVSQHGSGLLPSHTARPRAARHRLRRLTLRISVVAKCFYSEVSASSRGPSSPASTLVRAHSFGPSRPRPRRPSAFPHRRSLPLLQGA